MNRVVLNKDVKIENKEVVITENVETRLDRAQLELKLRDIGMQKARLKEQNAKVVSDFNKLLEEEVELEGLIGQLDVNSGIEEIQGP